MWRDTITGEVVDRHDQMRALRPNVSIPPAMTDEIIAALGFEKIEPEQKGDE